MPCYNVSMKYRKNRIEYFQQAIVFAALTALMVALATGVYFIPIDTSYSHYDAGGVISSFTVRGGRGGDLYEFTLEGDDRVYCLDNIAQKNFHGKEKEVMTVGSTVSLSVAKTDSRGRLCISRFEKDGITYLSVDDFERAHKSNRIAKYAITGVFYGFGAMCLGITIYNAAMSKRKTAPKTNK